jgi:hypothetical protein
LTVITFPVHAEKLNSMFATRDPEDPNANMLLELAATLVGQFPVVAAHVPPAPVIVSRFALGTVIIDVKVCAPAASVTVAPVVMAAPSMSVFISAHEVQVHVGLSPEQAAPATPTKSKGITQASRIPYRFI